MCCMQLAENTGRKNSPSTHHRTTLSGYIFATKGCIDNRKNLLNSNISCTCRQNIVNFGPLTAEICWQVWSTPENLYGFRVEGTTSEGGHHAHILVVGYLFCPKHAEGTPLPLWCDVSSFFMWVDVIRHNSAVVSQVSYSHCLGCTPIVLRQSVFCLSRFSVGTV